MSILGALSIEQFLSENWQRKPLLIRQALPDYTVPFSADELAGLATQQEVESRLVLEDAKTHSWQLRHGPFSETDFASLPPRMWSLLVQAIDLWVPEISTLLNEFDFLPRWRLDDVMGSFAVPGGGVGPHFDQYDVFLVQVEGQRRWRIGPMCDKNTPCIPGLDLKILRDFDSEQEWLLEPGDVLYVPPGIAHWGIAETQCMTFSVGFRAPSMADMLGDLAIELAAQDNDTHLTDPPMSGSMAQLEIDQEFIAHARRSMSQLLKSDELIGDWFARYMTLPKYPDLLDQTQERRRAKYAGRVYVNGEPEE